jgi:hypothetical protein
VAPLIAIGARKSLEGGDVWLVSPYMRAEVRWLFLPLSRTDRAQVLWSRFKVYKARLLVWRIFGANSLDFSMSIILAFVSAALGALILRL